jgi:HEAT repeat protein
VQPRILAILGACCFLFAIAVSLHAETAADLPKLIADAAQWQSGQNVEPVQKIEQLLRDSVGKPALRAELETASVKLLAASATFEARRFACQILAVVGSDASLPALAELLKDDETAGIACLALSTQRSPKASEVLRNALGSARGRTRLQIIGALGNHQGAESVAVLVELARDADAAVAETAIFALGKIGNTAAHDAIAALRKEPKPAQARAVTEATLRVAKQLAAAGDRDAASAIYMELLKPNAPTNIRRGVFAALMRLDKDGGEKRIIETLGGSDATLIPVAIARVALLKSDVASKTFSEMLPRLSPSARAWMIEALARRGDAATRSAIRAELSATDAEIRRAAIMAVGKLDDASAVGLLTKMLAGAKATEEVQDIELALASLRGGAATDQALVAELEQSSAAVKVRLISIFPRRGARVAVPALLAEAGGSDTATVRAAFQALGKLVAADDLPAILEKLVGLKAADARADAELAAARAMAKIADAPRRSEAVLAILAKSADIEARCSLLRLLPNAADTSGLAALEAAGGDKEPRIRDTAVRALAAWPDATGWNAILAVVRRPENDAHRALALRALVRLAGDLNAKPDAALVERYRQLLAGARGDDELKLVLGALAGAAHPDALQLALPMLSNAGVRAEAELAVKKIAASVAAQHPQAAQAALERLKQAKP